MQRLSTLLVGHRDECRFAPHRFDFKATCRRTRIESYLKLFDQAARWVFAFEKPLEAISRRDFEHATAMSAIIMD